MAKQRVRIRLKAFDHKILIVLLKRSWKLQADWGNCFRANPLPTDKSVFTVLRSFHIHKDSREQFEMRTHKRLIDILSQPPKRLMH